MVFVVIVFTKVKLLFKCIVLWVRGHVDCRHVVYANEEVGHQVCCRYWSVAGALATAACAVMVGEAVRCIGRGWVSARIGVSHLVFGVV